MYMNSNRVSRSEMNRLMAIPEARQIIEAKLAELRLMFKDKLEHPGDAPCTTSNIIRFPKKALAETAQDNASAAPGPHQNGDMENLIKIVDASRYSREPEAAQVKIFMDYFENHGVIRRTILDEFFLRLLPYSDICIEI